jgi:3-oxoadipate enol-lactonase
MNSFNKLAYKIVIAILIITGVPAMSQELLESEKLSIEVEGATLHVEVNGDKDSPALLMWPGYFCTTRMWDNTIPRLAEHFRVVRFDVRGAGLSGPCDLEDDFSLERHADDAVKILDELGIEKSVVWSMAWGSRTGTVYASRHADKVIALALYDANVDRADVDAQNRDRVKAFELQDEKGIPRTRRPEGWNFHKDEASAQHSYGAAGRTKDLAGFLDGITAPTLVCTGDFDPNLVNSRVMAKQIKNAELVIMEGIAHGSVLQRPDVTVDHFLAFMKKQGVIE